MSIETQRVQELIKKLAAANSDDSKYFTDQLIAEFGTARKSEIEGIIGDAGVPYEKLLQDHIDSL